jgi:hypothetical protein
MFFRLLGHVRTFFPFLLVIHFWAELYYVSTAGNNPENDGRITPLPETAKNW